MIRKRIFGLLVAMAVVFAFLPMFSAEVNADTGHNHDGWTAWDNPNSFPRKTGNYYLTTDVKLGSSYGNFGGKQTVEINVCLNGHVVDLNGQWLAAIANDTIPAVYKLSIFDEGETTHKFSVDENGLWKLDEANGDKIVSGGVITNSGSPCNVFSMTYGGEGSKIVLNGGNIVGCSYGDAPLLDLGIDTIFEMNDGHIIGNVILSSSNIGNAIIGTGGSSNSKSYFYMKGGTIEQNRIYKGTSGNSDRYVLSGKGGTINIEGGEIRDNYVEAGPIIGPGNQYGGNFYMTGGIITGNTASKGAVYPGYSCTNCVLTGGEIVNNETYGLMTSLKEKIVLGGSINISGNTHEKDGKRIPNDVNISWPFILGTGDYAPKTGMCLGVYSSSTQVTTNGTQEDIKYLYSNIPTSYISYYSNNGCFILMQPSGGKYAINVIPSANGTVIPNTYEVKSGETVTLTAKPDTGGSYKVGNLKVTYNDGSASQDVPLTPDSSDPMKYTFTMPAYPVTIEAEFVAAPQIIVSQQGTNPTYGTASSDSAFFTVSTKSFAEEPTLRLEWKTGTGESAVWSTTAPTGITAGLSGTNISIATDASLNAGNYVFRVTNSEDEFTAGAINPDFVSSGELALTVEKIDSSATAPTANSLTYNGTAQGLVSDGTATGGTMQYALGEDAVTEPASGWEASVPQGKDAKTYYIWYRVAGDENHNDTVAACVSVAIAKKDITVIITPNGGTYNSTVTGATAILNGLENGDNVTPVLTYTADGYNSTTVPVNAGEYTVTASLPDTAVNYNLAGPVTENFVIEQAVIEVPVINSKTYTGSTLKADVDVTGKPYEVFINAGGTNAGSYPVTLIIKDDEGRNYKWEEPDAAGGSSKTLYFEITSADNSWITAPSVENVVYGTAVSPVGESEFGNVVITYVGIDGTVYENNTTAPAKAGKYKATFSVESTLEYGSLTENVEFAILKKQLIISDTTIETSRVYDGTVVADVTSTGTLDNTESGDDVTVSAEAVFADANVGTAKAVTVIYDISGADADNYIAPESNTSLTASITAKEVTAPNIASKLYIGELLKADVSDTADYIVTKNDGGTEVGGYEVILTLIDTVNYKWSDSDRADKNLTFIITSTANNWTTEPSIDNVTYGTPVSPAYAAKFGNNTLVITYVGINDTTYESSTTAPAKAGTYKATFAVAGTPDYGSLTENVVFTISKKQLTVTGTTIIPSRVYDGTTIADIETVGILDNIETGDVVALTATAAYSDANVGTAKAITVTYAISGDDEENYFAPVNNTLLTADINAGNVTAPAIAGKVYNGSLQKAEVPASELYTVTANDGGTAVGNYDVILTLKDSVNYKWENSDDAALTLIFEITARPKYVINGYADSFGNKVTADYQNAEKDTDVTLSVLPAEEYILSSLSVTTAAGEPVAVTSDYKFTMPADAVTVTAVFTKNTYAITGYSDAEGNAVTADVRLAAKGDKVTLTVLPADNYGLSSLTVTDASGATVPVADDMTFTMPASDVTVNAEFDPGVFGITGYSDIYGNSVTADVKSAAKGENVKLTVSPANGYYVRNVNVTDENGNPVAVAGDSTFVMPAAKVTVSADFAVITYEIITYSDNNGNSVASNMVIAQPGNKVTLTVKTAEGFELKSLTVADAFGNSVTLSGDCSFVMPSSKATVNAVFEEEKPDDIIPEDPDTDPVKPDTDSEKPDTEQEAVLEIETDLTSSSDSDALVKMIEESDAKKIVLNASEKSVTEQGLENKKTAEEADGRITEVTKEEDSKAVVIDEAVLESLADAENIESVEINTSVVDLEFDAKSIESINKQKNGDIKIVVKLLKEEIAENENESSRAYFEISMLNGDGTPITEFDGGEVKITMPIPASMQGKELVCVYTDGNGHYSPVDGKIQKNGTFASFTTHFSEYILMTKEEAEELYNCIYDYLTLQVKATECTADSVKLDWNRYDDAEGYIVYGSLCNGNGKKYKLKKLAVINDPETTEFTVTGLEEGRHYKFRVKAFKVVNGKKYVTVKTYLVHATTAGGKCKTTAAVDIDQTGMKKANALTLKAGRTYDIKAVRYDAKGSKVRHSGIKYQSTNPEIATVSLKTGKITAVGKGKCSVFVIAENGLCEEIKVTVK